MNRQLFSFCADLHAEKSFLRTCTLNFENLHAEMLEPGDIDAQYVLEEYKQYRHIDRHVVHRLHILSVV